MKKRKQDKATQNGVSQLELLNLLLEHYVISNKYVSERCVEDWYHNLNLRVVLLQNLMIVMSKFNEKA